MDHDEEGFRDGTSCRDGDDDRHLHAGRERDHEGHHEGDRAGERNRTATMGLKGHFQQMTSRCPTGRSATVIELYTAGSHRSDSWNIPALRKEEHKHE